MRVHTRWSETIGRQRRHRRRRSLNNRRPRSLRGPIPVVDTSAVIAREKEHARSAESLNCGNKRRCHLSPRCDSAFWGIPRPIPDHRDHRESREPACVSFSSSFSPSLRKSADSTSERAVSPISRIVSRSEGVRFLPGATSVRQEEGPRGSLRLEIRAGRFVPKSKAHPGIRSGGVI